MTEPTLLQYLEHMSDFTRDALGFVRGLTLEQFGEDRKTQQAVLNALQTVGEAAGRLNQRYPRFVERHADVPWRAMQGMRNRLAHGYFDVKLDVVWQVLVENLPRLEEQLPGVRLDAEAWLRGGGAGG